MSKNFNLLEQAEVVHTLTKEQKAIKFEAGLQEEKSISYSINAKSRWDRLPVLDKTFDAYYNAFSSSINKHNTLDSSSSNRRSQISQVDTRGCGRSRRGRSGRGRGRGGRGGRSGRGSGNGHGDRYKRHNPYAIVRGQNGSSVTENKVYSRNEYYNMTKDQKMRVQEVKSESGWTDGNTPPSGFVVDDNGYPTISNQLVSAIQSTISEVNTVSNTTHEHAIVPLPPVPTGICIPPTPMVITDESSIGSSFGRSGSRQPRQDNSSIS